MTKFDKNKKLTAHFDLLKSADVKFEVMRQKRDKEKKEYEWFARAESDDNHPRTLPHGGRPQQDDLRHRGRVELNVEGHNTHRPSMEALHMRKQLFPIFFYFC